MKIAIIDDQHEIRYSVSKILQRNNHIAFTYNGEEENFCESILEQGIELLIMDVMLGDHLTGINLVKKLKSQNILLPVILMTAYTTPANMIEASKAGVKEILQKPFDETELITLVNKHINLSKKDKSTKPLLKKGKEEFIGSYETMKEIYKKIGIAANNDLCVLIYGETGTGKELIANLISTNSSTANSAFIAVNCASIPKELFESQLFGHEKGSFTGADKQHIGFAEQAAEGTLFLDEIGELDFELQSKLLRFLENKKYRRVGGLKELTFSGRIISATNVNLKENIKKNMFREDLYFRLSMLSINLPNLLQRHQDIPILCEHFISKANKELKTAITSISEEALKKLQKKVWHGNIRELRNTIYSVCLNAQDAKIVVDDLNELEIEKDSIEEEIKKLCTLYFQQEGIEKAKNLETIFKQELLHVAIKICPNISQLSTALDISRNTLKKQLKDFNLYKGDES